MIRVLVSALTGCVIAASLALAQWGQPMMISGGSGQSQTVASIALSNSTFTNSSANATVGTVSVTMSPASPAFTGSLSITGTNSGGFHLVGTTLETNAGGTTSGTYSDLTIVATQTGAGSKSISPTLVGSAGGGVACFSGPNAPAPPTIATNAGFGTCVLNVDFSTSAYAVTSNWLDCNSTDGSKLWHLTGQPNFPPCSRIFQTTDGGATVLDMQFQAGDANFPLIVTCTAALPTSACFTYPNFYVETVVRIDNSSGDTNNHSLVGVWSGQASDSVVVNNEVEVDYIETANYGAVGGDAGIHNWSTCSSCANAIWSTSQDSPVLPSGYNGLAYHKYGVLFTSGGAGNIFEGTANQYACGFVDDVLADNCVAVDTTTAEFLFRSYMIMSSIKDGIPPTANFYIQYARVYSCANWNQPGTTYDAAHMCNGLTAAQSTTAQGKTFTYWHP